MCDFILLDKMIFYYEGFILDLNTKKWNPPKDTDVNSIKKISDSKLYNIFSDYNFQKEYLKNDPKMIFNFYNKLDDNYPLLNNDIKDEYGYVLKSKKYNI